MSIIGTRPPDFKRQKRQKTTPLIAFLKDVTYSHIYGRWVGGDVYPNKSKDDFIRTWNQGRFVTHLANYHYQDHFDGAEVYYFFGTPNVRATHSLAVIDIDVQKTLGKGTPEGARAFVEYLRANHFPDLLAEPSRGGKGMGCPILIEKSGVGGAALNQSLDRLQAWLSSLAVNFDIEAVEVKGHCPEITWDENDCIKAMKFGSFARIPRSFTHEQVRGTTCISWLDLRKPKYDPVISQTFQPKKKEHRSYRQCISQDDLDRLPDYEQLYRRLIQRHNHGQELKSRWRYVVGASHFAIACLILKYLHENPNADGSLPQERAKRLWEELYAADDVAEPWNHHRWKVIRDFLSSLGCISWEDETYYPGSAGEKGKACKWCITEDFVDVLTTTGNKGGTFTDTTIPSSGFGECLVPVLVFPFVQYPGYLRPETWLEAEKALESLYAA